MEKKLGLKRKNKRVEYLKTYEDFRSDFNEYSLNEGFWQNMGDVMSKPFAKIIKSRLKEKSDEEKLNLLEKILRGINFTNTWKGLVIIYSPLVILPTLKAFFPSIATEESIVYWIYWIIYMLVISLRLRYKNEIKNLIGMVKNDYVRKKIEDLVGDKTDVDPFGEESWVEKRIPDEFENRAEALIKDSYICDVEITFNREYYNTKKDEQILDLIYWQTLDMYFVERVDEDIQIKFIGNKLIMKNMYIKMDKIEKFKKECVKKLNRVGRDFGLSNFNVGVIRK